MTAAEFFDEVEAHPDLMHKGTSEALTYLAHRPTKAIWSIRPEAVAANPWPVLVEIFTAERQVKVLHYWARIVGYYSDVDNWNLSKRGELQDRRKGDYGVSEVTNG